MIADASAAARQARKKEELKRLGGQRVSINLPADSMADLKRIKTIYSKKITNNSEAVILALRWYARVKL